MIFLRKPVYLVFILALLACLTFVDSHQMESKEMSGGNIRRGPRESQRNGRGYARITRPARRRLPLPTGYDADDDDESPQEYGVGARGCVRCCNYHDTCPCCNTGLGRPRPLGHY